MLAGFDDLGDRPIVLVMGGVDPAFARALARATGRDVLVTPDEVHQDADVRAVRDGAEGRWLHLPADGGEPFVYGADLEEVLRAEIDAERRGERATDPPGTMTPDPVIIW